MDITVWDIALSQKDILTEYETKLNYYLDYSGLSKLGKINDKYKLDIQNNSVIVYVLVNNSYKGYAISLNKIENPTEADKDIYLHSTFYVIRQNQTYPIFYGYAVDANKNKGLPLQLGGGSIENVVFFKELETAKEILRVANSRVSPENLQRGYCSKLIEVTITNPKLLTPIKVACNKQEFTGFIDKQNFNQFLDGIYKTDWKQYPVLKSYENIKNSKVLA